MTKIALLMGGEFRNFYHCYETWINQLEGELEFDLFLSTWNTSSTYSNKHIQNDEKINEFVVNKEDIELFVGDRLKFCNIEKEINFTHRGNKQLYHWFLLLTHLMNYQTEYSYVFITRPDVKIDNTVNFVESLKMIDKTFLHASSEIYIDTTKYFKYTMHDIYFLGTPNIVIESLLYIPLMKTASFKDRIEGKGINLHNHFAEHFVKENIKILPFKFGTIKDSSWIMRENLEIKK